MVLFLLRSAGSPWNLLRCGRRWTTSSSADCACQMLLPKAFVFRQLIFGINANPHYKSSARFVCDSVWPRRGLLAVCGTYFAFCRSSSGNGFFAPIVPAFFLLYLKYAWARGVFLPTPLAFFFVARPPRKVERGGATAVGARRAGFVTLGRHRSTPGYL